MLNEFRHEELCPYLLKIGKGKFGLVFIGRHSNGNKHVAIKYIPKQIIFETQSSTRIQQVQYAMNGSNDNIHC